MSVTLPMALERAFVRPNMVRRSTLRNMLMPRQLQTKYFRRKYFAARAFGIIRSGGGNIQLHNRGDDYNDDSNQQT